MRRYGAGSGPVDPMRLRVAIVGGRLHLWRDVEAIRAIVYSTVAKTQPSAVIVSGESPGGGVDIWARQAAAFYGREFKAWPPRSRASAELKARNQRIIDDCHAVVAIVAPKSRGTHDTIKRARVKFADTRLIMVSWPEGDGSEA